MRLQCINTGTLLAKCRATSKNSKCAECNPGAPPPRPAPCPAPPPPGRPPSGAPGRFALSLPCAAAHHLFALPSQPLLLAGAPAPQLPRSLAAPQLDSLSQSRRRRGSCAPPGGA